jgi:hypothetical protein
VSTPCLAGSYADVAGLAACKPCPPRAYCGVGAVTPAPCPAGFFCPANTTAPAQWPCPASTFSNASGLASAAECTPCSPGSYCASPGLTAPSGACAAGSVLKVTSDAQYDDGVAFDAAAGELRSLKCPGFCLSGTTAQRNPPCEGGEWTAPAQVALVECGTADAGGWTSAPALVREAR